MAFLHCPYLKSVLNEVFRRWQGTVDLLNQQTQDLQISLISGQKHMDPWRQLELSVPCEGLKGPQNLLISSSMVSEGSSEIEPP